MESIESVDASTTATAYLVVPTSAIGYLAGARLKAGADAATAVLRETNGSGRILAVLGAGIGLCDEFMPPKPVTYRTAVFVTLTGTSPILNLFQA